MQTGSQFQCFKFQKMFPDGEALIYSYLETFEVVKLQQELKIPFSFASYNHTLNTKNLTESEIKKLLPHAWKTIILSSNIDCTTFPFHTCSHLTTLYLSETNVSNLAPLKGMPLTTLDLSFTNVPNLEPLKGIQVKIIGLGV